MPARPKNADVRTREYLTDDEVRRLVEAAKVNRHGLRASELTDLRWDWPSVLNLKFAALRLGFGGRVVHAESLD